jgi:capsular polysaccharide biosynthesis protein
MTNLENTNSSSSLQERQLELKELFNILWKSKTPIIITAFVFFAVAAIYILNQPDQFKSSASMSVAKQSSGTNIVTSINFSGLSVEQTGVKGPRYVNTVRSRGFFKYLIEVDEDFLPALVLPHLGYAEYDEKSKKLIYDSDAYDVVNKKWLIEKPHYLDSYNIYMSRMYIVYHNERHIIDISFSHISPVDAKEIVESIIYEADQMLRNLDLKESAESLAYLTTAIPKTQQLAIRGVMNDMIMNQLETQMMAAIGPTYIVQIVDPPFVPLYRYAPNRRFVAFSAGLVGLVFGIVFVLIRHLRNQASEQAS